MKKTNEIKFRFDPEVVERLNEAIRRLKVAFGRLSVVASKYKAMDNHRRREFLRRFSRRHGRFIQNGR